MAKKTKAELLNEIDRLRDEMHASSDVLDEKVKENKELQATVRAGDTLIGKQAKKIKQLRALWRDADIASVEKGCEIKRLKDVVIALRNDCNNLQADLEFANTAHRDKDSHIIQLQADAVHDAKESDEKTIEIKDLHDSVRQRDALITVKDKENGQLRVLLDGADQVIDENAKEISKLDKAIAELWRMSTEKDHEIKNLQQEHTTSRDYSDKQASVIHNYLNQIGELERRLELAEKFSNYREFHNATVAMGNPQYFQRVSND